MIKTFKLIYLIAILPVLLFSACEKDGTHIMPTLKAINKNLDIRGFVLGDTLEQYFDGVKVRDYYGQVRTTGSMNQLAFVRDEINMELRKKSTGETIYRQKFNINDKESIVPNFYFDGAKLSNQYAYPSPEGNAYTINFYMDPSYAATPFTVNIEVLEYLYDSTKPDPIIVVSTKVIPLMENIQPGSWSAYKEIKVPVFQDQTQSGTDFYPIVVVRDAKTKEYYVNKNRDQSTISSIELPYDGVSPGKVQSMYLNRRPASAKIFYLESYELVQLFPR
jgi:hypothetical protein